MKKQYANPAVKIVYIEDADIVTESMDFGDEVSGVSAHSKRRYNTLEEDE